MEMLNFYSEKRRGISDLMDNIVPVFRKECELTYCNIGGLIKGLYPSQCDSRPTEVKARAPYGMGRI